MTDGTHLRPGWTWRDALPWLAAVLATFAVLALPPALQGPAGSPAATIVSAEMLGAHGAWRPVDLHALTLPRGQVSRLRARIDLAPSTLHAGQPLALYLSGDFSAAATWNGASIGHKGRPGASEAAEQPGLIDSVLPLPAGAVKAGDNLLTLDLSAERPLAAHSVIHGDGAIFGLRVAPFSADARRPLGYYAAPLLMLGVLSLALMLMAARGEVRSAATAILAGLLVCAVAELSRSVIDYPYPFQALRMAVLKAGAATVALGEVLLVLDALPWRGPACRWRFATAAVWALAVVVPLDASVVIVSGALAGGLIGSVRAIRTRDVGLLQKAVALLVVAAISRIAGQDFMDQGLYAGSAPLVTSLLLRPRLRDAAVVDAPAATGPLVMGPVSARRLLDPQSIRAIHAAGDYVEVSLADGRRLLEAQALSALAARLPAEFLRVHRSHVVNLAHAQELRSQGGGRYRLRVGEDLWVPVSRARISEVRARLGC